MKTIQLLCRHAAFCWALVVAMLVIPASAGAQSVLTGAGVQTGTIQQEAQDDGYLMISGTRYDFSSALTKIYLNGEQIETEILDEGLVVRYTTDGNGMLTSIELLGPANLIRSIEDS